MLINNRYLMQDSIGSGLMAVIYRSIDTHTDQAVAIKVLRETYSADPKFVKRFQKEAEIMASLQHPNIIQVYDYGQIDDTYFNILELIEGTDLRRYLRSSRILAIDSTIKIAHDASLGLGVAHSRGIVLRTAIPQHILLSRDGSIKLTGFSIASVYGMSREELSTTGTSLNYVQYYAPEQAMGEIVTPAADVYSLGSVVYEMLTGHPPFDGNSPVAIAMQHIQDAPTPNPVNLIQIFLRHLRKLSCVALKRHLICAIVMVLNWR